MSNVGSLVVDLKLDTTAFEEGLARARKMLEEFEAAKVKAAGDHRPRYSCDIRFVDGAFITVYSHDGDGLERLKKITEWVKTNGVHV